MMTEKIRVNASSVMSNVPDTRLTPARCRADGRSTVTGVSVPFGVRPSLSATVLRRAFVLASVVWAVLLPVAAYAASRSPGSSLVYGSVAVVYAIGSIVCHQLPARSIHLWGAQMP